MMPRTLLLALVALLPACATPPASSPPVTAELPAQWQHGEATGGELARDWWRAFGSAELDALIGRAQQQSVDVAAAVARVQQAQARARIAGASLLPELAASADARREGSLDDGADDGDGKRYGAALALSYEIDFWGRNRALRDSARSGLRASVFERDTVLLGVTAGVASGWLQTVALHERGGIAALNLGSAERLLALIESRARAGAATPLELAQQRGLVATQRRSLAVLRMQAADAQAALRILLAQTDGTVATTSLAALQSPDTGAGLPSALLTRRPDLARLEAQLAAADADIVAARAAMLPSLRLDASVGSGGDRLRRIFDDPLYSLAAGLTAPIFNAGRLAAGRDLALAQREELLAAYRGGIVTAFAEVERALNASAGIDAQRLAQAEELLQAQRAVTLAESRYRAGAETLLSLIDAQRTLYAAQDAAVQLQAARLLAAVDLYRALGGGWQTGAASASALP